MECKHINFETLSSTCNGYPKLQNGVKVYELKHCLDCKATWIETHCGNYTQGTESKVLEV